MEKVTFKTRLQRGNRVQVSKLSDGDSSLNPDQILKITVKASGLVAVSESFNAQMSKDGRVVVPKLVFDLLKRINPNL